MKDLLQCREGLPDSRSELTIGDYTISLLSQSPVSHTRTLQKLYEFLVEMLSLSGRDSGLVSFETGALSAYPVIFDPCGFP